MVNEGQTNTYCENVMHVIVSVLTEYMQSAPAPALENLYTDNESLDRIKRLQRRYERQVSDRRACIDLRRNMSGMSAWTWTTRFDRKMSSGVIDINNLALLVLAHTTVKSSSHHCIPLSLFCPQYKYPVVNCASPENIFWYKDFGWQPKLHGHSRVLDSRSERLFCDALALDSAIEAVATGKRQADNTFKPPKVLLGYAKSYVPIMSWCPDTQSMIMKMLADELPLPKSTFSPGGKVSENYYKDGKYHVEISNSTGKFKFFVPGDAKLNEDVVVGRYIRKDCPLIELPYAKYKSAEDVTAHVSHSTIDWILEGVLSDALETIVVADCVSCANGSYHHRSSTWNCYPASVAYPVIGKAKRVFIDLRDQFGRQELDDKFDSDDLAIFVANANTPMNFGDGASWVADLRGIFSDDAWTAEHKKRGEQFEGQTA